MEKWRNSPELFTPRPRFHFALQFDANILFPPPHLRTELHRGSSYLRPPRLDPTRPFDVPRCLHLVQLLATFQSSAFLTRTIYTNRKTRRSQGHATGRYLEEDKVSPHYDTLLTIAVRVSITRTYPRQVLPHLHHSRNLTFIRPCIVIYTVKPTRCTSFSNCLFWYNILHVSDGLSVHHYLAHGSRQVAVSVWHTPVAVCTVLNSWWWTERPSETCRVLCRNKQFEKLVHLVDFTTGILKSNWQNTQIMYPLFQFCAIFCHPFRSHSTIDTLFPDIPNRHANFRFHFVAQYLLFTAPTCFGHIILPSAGSYTLHRSLQHTLQVCTFYLLCMFYSVYSVLIVPTGTLRLPWLRFFRVFSSVVRQMPRYNSQRRGTARTLPN
jgi:hypothetical protein